jgi:GH3 auxin-responsive promoter
VAHVLRHLLTAQQWVHRRAFEAATAAPAAAQARVLARLLSTNAGTVFGREHGFATTETPATFARRVPIRDYEAFRPYMNRVVAGEAAVLTAEAPLMFATTSGTTGEPKLVPVTESAARDTAALMRLWTVHALRDHPNLLDHRVLTMVGPAVEGRIGSGLPIGAMTGMIQQRLPWLVRRQQAVPYAVALVRDAETRYLLTARLALAHSVSSVGTPNASTLLRLAEVATRHADRLCRAIHDGTLGVECVEAIAGTGVNHADLLATLKAGLRPDPGRAAALEAVARRHGRLVLGACWPELALVACWLGGSAGIQARHLDAHFPGVPRRDLGLVASEGRLTVPLDDDSAAGVLAVHTGFFEFIAEEEIDAPSPRTLLCHELEDGRRYYVVVTAANGLYRYDMNDVVEVRGFHRRTPRLAFVRKGRDMLNITGEKLHLNHVLHALHVAEAATGRGIWQLRLIPDVEASRYDLLLELTRPADDVRSLSGLRDAFDRALRDVNVEYAAKRVSERLGLPRLHLMRPGWSERLCRQEFARGRRDVQHKWGVLRPEWDASSRGEVLATLDEAERLGIGA